MSKHLLLTLLTFCIATVNINAQSDTNRTEYRAASSDQHIIIKDYTISSDAEGLLIRSPEAEGFTTLYINGEAQEFRFEEGKARWDREVDREGELLLLRSESDQYQLVHLSEQRSGDLRIRQIPLIAILLALIFREVVVSLFIGIWTGAFIVGGLRIESFYYFARSFLSVIDRYVIGALNDSGHLSIIVFSILIGGMVAIISRNGGMSGVVNGLSHYARTPRSAQFITWLLGVAIFFDDYANTLIVGNTMRSVTDRFKISREKLAYIVDSTAAPVAAIAFTTTWIGAELSYIDDGISMLNNYDGPDTPYALFIASLKYSFYPVLTLGFILLLVRSGKDFGKMFDAEYRARSTGQVSPQTTSLDEINDVEDLNPVKDAPMRWRDAVIPVAAVILVTIYGLIDTGMDTTLSALQEAGAEVQGTGWGATWAAMGAVTPTENPSFFLKIGTLIGNADSYVALLWASLIGVVLALGLTIGGRIMKLEDSITTLITGFKTMMPALLILTLAWSLAATTEELHTATFLTQALEDSINPFLMPVLIFVLAAGIAFSTGSSWSTMAILYPIAIPTTWAVCLANGLSPDISLEILLNVIATVLAASVLGDHCSPISDTTILSSLASDCNHIDHVRTQLPYALTVGSIAITLGGVSTLLGGGWLVCSGLLLLGFAALFLIIRQVGKPVDQLIAQKEDREQV